jgi:hypothetical protein
MIKRNFKVLSFLKYTLKHPSASMKPESHALFKLIKLFLIGLFKFNLSFNLI